jgi:dolichol-phosphate mannosyltransferase
MSDRILAVAPSYNEEGKIARTFANMPRDLVTTYLLVDDGSTDGTAEEARSVGVEVISHPQNCGVGAAIRTGVDFAIENQYDVVVIMSGSGKTRAEEIGRLVTPVAQGRCDMAKGSRYVRGGVCGAMPLQRKIGTRGYSFVISVLARHWITDASNGYRAFRVSLFEDKRLNIWQDSLDRYALEPYLLYQVIRLGYRLLEVPVTIDYPVVPGKSFTKMRAFADWWNVTAPVVQLALGLRK